MKKPYQIEAQRGMNRLEEMAADGPDDRAGPPALARNEPTLLAKSDHLPTAEDRRTSR